MNRAVIFYRGRAIPFEGQRTSRQKLRVSNIMGRTDKRVHVNDAGATYSDPSGIDENDSTISFKCSRDHTGSAPVDTIERETGPAGLHKNGGLSQGDREGVPPHDQRIGSLINGQDISCIFDRSASMSHVPTDRIPRSGLEWRKGTTEGYKDAQGKGIEIFCMPKYP